MPAQILVVDDDAGQRSDLAEMVASLGFQVRTAGDGAEALQKLASFPASAILTDLVMPRMDGFKLLQGTGSARRPNSHHRSDGIRKHRPGDLGGS